MFTLDKEHFKSQLRLQRSIHIISVIMAPTGAAKKEKVVKAETGKANLQIVEKRARRFVSKPSQDVCDRIHRATSQRLYLIDQEDQSTSSELKKKYAVLGSTGNVYDVLISSQPTCNCPDCARGKLCKHIIFVLVKVLQVPRNSELIYQNALLQSELATMFENAPKSTSIVLAKEEVVNAYKKSVLGEEVKEEEKVEIAVTEKLPEGECPICFDSLETAEKLDSCATCRNFIHKDCLKKWLDVRNTCCYCRSKWCSFGTAPDAAARASQEGYVNLGAQQGLTGRRDTSTYHQRRRYGYGYYDNYDDEGEEM